MFVLHQRTGQGIDVCNGAAARPRCVPCSPSMATPDHAVTSDLTLSPEELRALGYRIVDHIVARQQSLRDQPLPRAATPDALASRLREPIPAQPTPAPDVLDTALRDIFGHYLAVDHPRFFAFVPGPSNSVAALADALVSAMNPFIGSWIAAPGPAMCELVTIDWLRQLCGLPDGAAGLFLSGGSMANLTGLLVALKHKADADPTSAVAYCSDQTHSAVDRAARAIGLRDAGLHKITSDERFRLPIDALREAIAADRRAGRRPFCVIANAGTTNTGAIDPLPEIANLCAQENLWLHVDGAYGAAASICEQGRTALAGMERAESLVLDPHKWLFQPFEIGCLLVRNGAALENTFSILPDYMKDVVAASGEVNFRDRSLQLTRSFRAFKLWMTIKVFGMDAIRSAVARAFHLADVAQAELKSMPDWEITTPSQMGVITFRYAPAALDEFARDAANDNLVQRMLDDGFAFVTSTRLRGRTVLRLCPINPRTTDDDIRETIRRFDRFARQQAQRT